MQSNWPNPFTATDDDIPGGAWTRPQRLSRRARLLRQVRRFAIVLACIVAVPGFYAVIAAVWGMDAMFGALGLTPITLLGLGTLWFIWDRCGAAD